MRLHVVGDRVRDLAFVERVATALRDRSPACSRDSGSSRSHPWPARCRSIVNCSVKPGIFRQTRHRQPPVVRDQFGQRKAFARVLDRRREIVLHRQLAEAIVQREPAVDRTGHVHRQRTERRNRLVIVILKPFQRERFRRAARTVVAVQLLRLRIPDDREQVAADAVRDRLHQAERRIRGDRRIDRGAAFLQHVETDLGRQRMRSRDHAVRRNDFRTRREWLAGNAVASVRCASDEGGEHTQCDAIHADFPKQSPASIRRGSRLGCAGRHARTGGRQTAPLSPSVVGPM